MKKLKKVSKPKKVKKTEDIVEKIVEEVLGVETKSFKEGDIIVDISCGKRFHFHNQSVVLAEPHRFKLA